MTDRKSSFSEIKARHKAYQCYKFTAYNPVFKQALKALHLTHEDRGHLLQMIKELEDHLIPIQEAIDAHTAGAIDEQDAFDKICEIMNY